MKQNSINSPSISQCSEKSDNVTADSKGFRSLITAYAHSLGGFFGTPAKRKKFFLSFLAVIIEIGLLSSILFFTVSACMKNSVRDRIITADQAATLRDVDCILILGAGIKPDGTPTNMLRDRLKVGIELYKNGTAPVILVSGDHTREDHDEVSVMKNYIAERDVPTDKIFRDHAGVCTYDSIYRAKSIFGVKKIVIVTQQYHLYRALYIAGQLGIEAYGVSATLDTYSKQVYRDIREVLARVKDFYCTLLEVKPKYLGKFISLYGDGNLT